LSANAHCPRLKTELDLRNPLKQQALTDSCAEPKFESLVEELESLAGRRVDLVTKRGLKAWIRPHVLHDARVIYAA